MALVKFQCSYCGMTRTVVKGCRPEPGSCPKKGKTKDGKTKPHSYKKC